MYKDLEIEIEKIWGMKTTTVPVVNWGFWACQEWNRKLHSFGKIPGNIRVTRLQKTVVLGTAHILLKEDPIHQVIQQTYDCPRFMD